MMCYKDRCFCTFYKECNKGHTCDKALTDKVLKEAIVWWGNGDSAPIDQYTEKPDCFKKKEG